MDYIDIDKLVVFANHGVYPEETALGQKFVLSARLYHVTSHAGMTGDLERGLHYGLVAQEMHDFFRSHTVPLIETAAEELARHLLMSFPPLHEVRLTVAKPWAPIGLPLESASVTIHRGWHPVLIALGSNLEDPRAQLFRAIDRLEAIPELRVKKISTLITTESVGHPGPPYANACLRADTVLLPRELLKRLQAVETEAGRVRSEKWAPRTLDLDLIFYDDLKSAAPALVLPHPRFRDRGFVLGPAAEIEPYWRDPETGQTLAELYQSYLAKQTH